MQHDAWFFIGIFAFIFVIWIAIGGPLRPLSFSGPTLALPEELGGGTYLRLPRATPIGGSNTQWQPGNTVQQQPVPAYTKYERSNNPNFGLISPYQNLVRMSHYVSNASSSDPKSEYIEISVAQNASQPVNITGWSLESGATYNAELFPKGTATPSSGVVNAAEDIVLQPGDRAFIISGKSPVGASFRENKCTGYFNSFQQFSPSLPQICPVPSDELLYSYAPYIHDPDCIDYTKTISRCQVALTRPANVSDTCKNFLESRLNYNGCLSAHKNDSDFGGTTWHIYLGREKNMWRSKYEIVRLFDDRGKTVDTFTY